MLVEKLLEKNLVPDPVIRFQIRRLLKQRLNEISGSNEAQFAKRLSQAPIAVSVDAANEQHYEVPAAFFERCLGPRMKYSCAWFDDPNETLASAEEKMLTLTCERAELSDGQEVLELGCGWGSLTLWMAEKYPNSRILGVSNSASQREFILSRAAQRGFKNVEILTCDMNQLALDRTFDRVVSVEMFEHMRNVPKLLERISRWMRPMAKLFVHIFTHRSNSYLFEIKDETDWMSKHFFTGGMMPSHSLYQAFDEHLKIEREWVVSGHHYSITAERWLENMDRHESEIRGIFEKVYGAKNAPLWWTRWRIFYMSCAELWGWSSGQEWHVSHYLFKKTEAN